MHTVDEHDDDLEARLERVEERLDELIGLVAEVIGVAVRRES